MISKEINSYSNNDFIITLYGNKLNSGEYSSCYKITIGNRWAFECYSLELAEYIYRLICDDIDNMCVVKWYIG